MVLSKIKFKNIILPNESIWFFTFLFAWEVKRKFKPNNITVIVTENRTSLKQPTIDNLNCDCSISIEIEITVAYTNFLFREYFPSAVHMFCNLIDFILNVETEFVRRKKFSDWSVLIFRNGIIKKNGITEYFALIKVHSLKN